MSDPASSASTPLPPAPAPAGLRAVGLAINYLALALGAVSAVTLGQARGWLDTLDFDLAPRMVQLIELLQPRLGLAMATSLASFLPLVLVALLGLVPVLVVQWSLLALGSTDLGKLATGLRVVRAGSRDRAGMVRAWLLRTLVHRLLTLVPLVGQLYALFDAAFIYTERGRCLRDVLFGTDVIRVRKNPGLIDWAFLQFGAALALVGQLALLGALASMVRREFRWRAFFVATFVALAGITLVAVIVFSGPTPIRGEQEMLLWGGSIGAVFFAGALAGRTAKDVAFWECYLALLLTVALVFVHLARGWHLVLGFGVGSESEGGLDFMMPLAPGERYLGSMWDRVLLLVSVAGLLAILVGSSVAYLLSAGRWGRRDSFEWFVAERQLRGGAGLLSFTSIVAVLGIALGVASLVTVTSVMSGYQRDIQDRILSTNAHLVVQKYGIDFIEYEEAGEKIRGVPGVLATTPFTFNDAMVSVEDFATGILLKGVRPSTAGAVTDIEKNLCAAATETGCERYTDGAAHLGELLAVVDDVPALIVGYELYKKLGKPVGSRLAVTTPVGIAGARGNAPRRMVFRLGGVFRSGMHEFDERLAYLELSAAQKLMGLGRAVSGVEIRVADPEHVETIARQVYIAVGRYPFRTLDWRELNASIFTALKLQKIVMFLVLCFIVVVAAFNIASTLFMAVVERAHDIAVLKSMGARDVSIMRVFVTQGWSTGGLGTLLGVVLGLLACALIGRLDIGIAADVYMVESLGVAVQPVEVVLVALAALAISHLAAVYPALRAARQRPVDAMRYDEV